MVYFKNDSETFAQTSLFTLLKTSLLNILMFYVDLRPNCPFFDWIIYPKQNLCNNIPNEVFFYRGGLAKIIPPKEWIPRRSGYNLRAEKDLANMKIPAPICQVVIRRWICFMAFPWLSNWKGGRRMCHFLNLTQELSQKMSNNSEILLW